MPYASSPRSPQSRQSTRLATRLTSAIRTRFARHEFRIVLTQILKSVLAATLAWWLSTTYLHTEFPFLAPWTALLSIHPTTYRTLARAAQTLVATILGIAVTYAVATFLGVEIWAYALALLLGLLIARLRWIREEGITVATMAIFLLSDGFSEDSALLGERVLEIAVGVAVGCAINLLILPPFRDQQATWLTRSAVERFGEILRGIGESKPEQWSAEDARSWQVATAELNSDLTHAWSQVNFARESRRINPRLLVFKGAGDQEWEEALRRTFAGLSHLQVLIDALAAHARQAADPPESNDEFIERWSAIAHSAGLYVENSDSRFRDSTELRQELASLGSDFSPELDPFSAPWPLYGTLLNSLDQVLELIDIRYPR